MSGARDTSGSAVGRAVSGGYDPGSREPSAQARPWRWRHLIAILAVATAMAGFAAWVLNRDIRLQIADRQHGLIDLLRERLSRETGHIATVQSAAVALLRQDPTLSQRAFADRMTPIMAAEPASGVRAVALTASVSGQDIGSALAAAYPDSARWPGRPVTVAPEGPREVGYPALRVAPEAGNEAVAGFDLWADPARRAAAQVALTGSLLAGSAPIVLSQDAGRDSDIISLLAVQPYSIPAETGWGQGVGIVASGYTLPAASLLPPGEINARIRDLGLIGGNGEPVVLFDRLRPPCLLCVETTVETRFLDRRWEVTLQSSYLQADPILGKALFVVPALFFLLVLVIGGWWSSLVRNQRELADKVDRQTAELSLAYRDVQASLHEAQEAIRSQQLFLQTMSHELRTPLNAIVGTAEIMADPALREMRILEDREAWQRMRLAGTRLFALVEALLFLSDIDRGAVAPVERPVRLSDVLADTVERLQRLREAETVPVTLTGLTDLEVETDPDLLARALVALIDNGLNAGAPVTVTVNDSLGAPTIAIRDRGPGLSEEAEATLFQRFAMSTDMDIKSRGGLGLGLATVAELSSLLGFLVSLQNHAEGGVEVVLAFGVDADRASIATAPAEA